MRKLLGYRLKEEFRQDKSIVKASCIIDGYENFGESISDGQVIYNYTSKLKQAGVMHWFEEVYEEEKYKKGDLVICEIGGTPNWIGVYDKTEEKECICQNGHFLMI